MNIKTLVACLVGVAVIALASPALASASSDPCLNGTAPHGWLREGGYCDIAHNLRSALPFTHDGGGAGGGIGGPNSPYGPVEYTLYRDASGNWSNVEPSGPHATAVYHERVVELTGSNGSQSLAYRY